MPFSLAFPLRPVFDTRAGHVRVTRPTFGPYCPCRRGFRARGPLACKQGVAGSNPASGLPRIPTGPGQNTPAGPSSAAAPSTPAAAPALRATRPKVTATGATVTFTAPGAGAATARGSTSQATRAGVTVCRDTTKVRKAGKATVTCVLNATGRRLRAKGTLAVTVTTVFAARGGARLQAVSAVVLPRRG